MRLQRLLAAHGCGSRRACEKLILAGRVTVNAAPAALGMSADSEHDVVAVDGKVLPKSLPQRRTILLHKPRGYLCTAAVGQGRTVYDLLPASVRALRIAGRLDKNSEGLLLLSNDGALLQQFMHPSGGHLKTYQVTVSGKVDEKILALLRQPLSLPDGYVARPAQVKILRPAKRVGRTILEFNLNEGRNRQVRRLCERAGLQVHRLVRTALGCFTLRGLALGAWREVKDGELRRS